MKSIRAITEEVLREHPIGVIGTSSSPVHVPRGAIVRYSKSRECYVFATNIIVAEDELNKTGLRYEVLNRMREYGMSGMPRTDTIIAYMRQMRGVLDKPQMVCFDSGRSFYVRRE
ncbi:MAG: hypothetical protein ACXQTR_01825 [Candidatus Methanospirareceae archaeon]